MTSYQTYAWKNLDIYTNGHGKFDFFSQKRQVSGSTCAMRSSLRVVSSVSIQPDEGLRISGEKLAPRAEMTNNSE